MFKSKETAILESPRNNSSSYSIKSKKNNSQLSLPLSDSPRSSLSFNESAKIISDNETESKPTPAPRKLKPVILIDSKLTQLNPDVSSPSIWETESGLSTDTKSYRAKVRNRFLSIKKQAGSSLSKTSTNSNIANIQASFNEQVKLMNQEIDSYKRNRNIASIENNEIVSNDMNAFFFGNVTKEERKQSTVPKTSDTILETLEITEERVYEDNTDTLVQFVKAGKLELNNPAKTIMFAGKYDTNIISNVTTKENDLRFLEDEGFYVGPKPNISSREEKILRKQLLHDNIKEWFGCDGEIKFVFDPRRNTFSKPYLLNEDCKFTTYIAPVPYYKQDIQSSEIKYLLELNIRSITFTHHHLFSAEHILAQQLVDIYSKYKKRTVHENVIRLEKKLSALRQAKEFLISNMNSGIELTEIQIQRLQKYNTDIKSVRSLFHKESKIDREIIKNILVCWKQVKHIRKKQKYSNTNVRLAITKEDCDVNIEKRDWIEAINNDLKEIIFEKELEYKEKYKQYKTELKKWKKHEGNSDTLSNPKKPNMAIDEDSIKKDLEEDFYNNFKPPGEPKLSFEFYYDNEITKETQYPREKARRDALERVKLFVKIYLNNQEACVTKSYPLSGNFCCKINEYIPIQVSQTIEDLTIELCEQSGKNVKYFYKDLHLTFNKVDTTLEFCGEKRCNFNSDSKITYSHTGVGSGNSLENTFSSYNFENDFDGDEIFTKGFLVYEIGWGIDEEKNFKFPPKWFYSNILKQNNSFDIHERVLQEFNQLDPQDPNNFEIQEYVQNVGTETIEKQYFEINNQTDIFRFCSQSEIDNNIRFKFLQLRQAKEPEFQIPVPNREKEIPLDVFNTYNNRKEKQLKSTVSKFKDPLDAIRQWGTEYLLQVYKNIYQISQTNESLVTLKDILIDDTSFHFGLLGSTFSNCFQPRRPLHPVRNTQPKKITITNESNLQIIINVVQAFEVPIRKDDENISASPISRHIDDENTYSVSTVRPFVMVSYKNQSARTTRGIGANPNWNQELILSFENKENKEISDWINIQLFDEIIIDLLEDDRLRDRDIHQRQQSNWLATLKIPFSALAQCTTMEGTFRMDAPPLLLGYERKGGLYDSRGSTYITLYMTLQPGLNILPTISEKLECSEIEYLAHHIKSWQNSYNKLYTHREFNCLVADINGITSCATRYFKPINIPDFNTDDPLSLEQLCVRYVSLIPFMYSNLNDSNQIWINSSQILKLLTGTITDHAILLQCYFMELEKISWLLFGYGIPYGKTAYILLEEYNDIDGTFYSIYDVTTGLKYNTKDSFCPLKNVYCLMNDKNVWANIQSEEHAHLTRFDLTRSSDWLPLFNSSVTSPIGTQQTIKFTYSDIQNIDRFVERIEHKLKSKIIKWRKHNPTVWNRHVSAVLKKLLPLLEKYVSGENTILNADNLNEFLRLSDSYKIQAFPLYMPYTSIKDIIATVKLKEIHLNENSNIEFALAVCLVPYQHYICSVWIFLASVIKRT